MPLNNLDDRETGEQIIENPYIQYFLGYQSFLTDKPFETSLFVDFRKKLELQIKNDFGLIIFNED